MPTSARAYFGLIAGLLVLAGCGDSGTAPALQGIGNRASVETTTGDLAVQALYSGQALDALQLTVCSWGLRARHLATNAVAIANGVCSLPLMSNLAPGDHEVKLSFAPGEVLMAPAQVATIVAGTVTGITIETDGTVGLVTGTVTLNGQPGANLQVCTTTGTPGGPPSPTAVTQCGFISPSANGVFRFLAPSGTNTIEIRGASFNLLHAATLNVIAGTTADLGTVALALGDLAVRPQYLSQDFQDLNLTLCAFGVRARNIATNVQATQNGMCGFMPFTSMTAGDYEIRLSFAPGESPVIPPQPASVAAGALTNVLLETSGSVGLVTGSVTLNGLPASNFQVCITNGIPNVPSPSTVSQCGFISPAANGEFRFLVPPGNNTVEIRGTAFNLLHSAALNVAAGQTNALGSIALALGDLSIKPRYHGQDLNSLELTHCSWGARARHVASDAVATQNGLCVFPPLPAITAGAYEVKLSFAPGEVLMAPPQPATVNAGALTTLVIETAGTVGVVSGNVIDNGQPGTGFQICVTNGTPGVPMPNALNQCGTIPAAHAGHFRFLMPAGCGTGEVRGPLFNVLATFRFCVTSGQESAVGNPLERSDNTPPLVVPSVVGTLGSNGWYTSDVLLSWTVDDPESAITARSCPPASVTTNTTGTTFTCSATSSGGTTTQTITLKRDANAPLIQFSNNAGTYTVDQTISIACAASDAISLVASVNCPSPSADAYSFGPGEHIVTATATDHAGNTATASTSFSVQVTGGSLCALVQRFVSQHGVANSLCVKLRQAESLAAQKEQLLRAFQNEVNAQSGKAIAAAHAQLLINLSQGL